MHFFVEKLCRFKNISYLCPRAIKCWQACRCTKKKLHVRFLERFTRVYSRAFLYNYLNILNEMKTKILLMAALLAATTAFFSCSSDETLAEVLPEEPQPAEVLPTDSGIPLTVTASTGNDTRAAELTNSNFNSFQLWAFEGATPWVGNAYDEENRQVGKEMEKDAETGWNAPGANWPNLNTDSKFYAISADYSSNNALTPHIEKGNASFTYTVASDAADQEDLLVGSTTASTATNNGKVDIEFDHILSKLNFTFKMDPSTIQVKV